MFKTLLTKCSLLLSILAVFSTAAQLLPDNIGCEIVARERLPKGSYSLIQSWEAEGSRNHMTGRAVDDPLASGGKAWEARRVDDVPNRHQMFGPYLDVPAGTYVVLFRLRLLDEAEDDVAACLDATIGGAVKVLAATDVWSGDLSRDRYVQIPFAFQTPGGELECRLFWNGYVGLRLDKMTLFALQGGSSTGALMRAPNAVPSGQPADLPYQSTVRPFPDVFPRALKPAPRQIVFDLQTQPYDWRMLLLCLQGLVNRERPSLYAILDETDRQWLDWMKQRGWVEGEETVVDPTRLVARYREKIKGAVIYDPRLASTKNVAMMIASVRDAVVVSPRLARELGLPVLEDLRGRWKTHSEAYRWASDTLWSQLNSYVMACLYPENADGLRDYLYQQRIFTFWITGPIDGALPGGNPTAEAQVMEGVLAKAPANIPVMGFPWAGEDVGIGEGAGVRLFAQYGKFLVGTVGVGNLSVHSGYSVPLFKQRPSPVPVLRPDKIYVTWLMSDGDNLPVLSRGNFPQLWRDKARGRVPIAWSLSPCAAMMIPAVVDYYFETASENDAFVGAVSGVGYTYPDNYAQQFDVDARTRLFSEFIGLTRDTLPRSDLKQIWLMGVSQPELLNRYAAELPGIDAIFPDYGKRLNRYDEMFYPAARGVPVFHAVTHWEEGATRSRKVELLVEELRGTLPVERPAFLHAFVWNWGADLSILPEVMQRLGPQYVAVGPEQLSALAKQSLAQQKLMIRSLSGVAAIEGRPVLFQVSVYNATDSSLQFKVAVTEGLGDAVAAPDGADIPAFQSRAITLQGKPVGPSLLFSLKGTWGERSKAVALRTVPEGELAGVLPEGVALRFVDRFEAAGLSHRSGKAQAAPSAPCGSVWVAEKGVTEPGHIVFGPYKPFPSGRYLALFQIKRSGVGVGNLARIDVHSEGGKNEAAARAISVSEAGLKLWRYYTLEFKHQGGALETRIFWPGKASLEVGEILLWEIIP